MLSIKEAAVINKTHPRVSELLRSLESSWDNKDKVVHLMCVEGRTFFGTETRYDSEDKMVIQFAMFAERTKDSGAEAFLELCYRYLEDNRENFVRKGRTF